MSHDVASLVPPAGAPLREKLAQLMMVRIGSNLPPVRTVEEDEERIAGLLADCPLGGLVIFNGSYAATPATLARLQSISRRPLLVSADFERGVGQQLRGYPLVPHSMAFEALGDGAEPAVREFAQLTGEASRAAGVHIAFAPVADVNSDPRNPIIATRAFGTDAARVSQLVTAFVEGCREGGVLATAKHFPGHGNTHEDSHHSLPTVSGDAHQLAQRDLPPFAAAIAADVPLVMTAHVRYPALDPSGNAATLSHAVLTTLLRERLGFEGAVISDSLLMEGVKAGHAHEGELALEALNAGVDILLDVAEPLKTLDALEAAVVAERLSVDRVDESLARVGRLKALVFGARSLSHFDEVKNRQQTQSLALDVARRATVIENGGGHLPLAADRSLCVVFINPFPLPSNAEPPPLGTLLRERFERLDYHELGAAPTDAHLNAVAESARRAEQLVCAFVVKPAAWHRFGLPPALAEWVGRLTRSRPTVVACLGAPQGLDPVTDAAAKICTYSDVPASQAALVAALLAP